MQTLLHAGHLAGGADDAGDATLVHHDIVDRERFLPLVPDPHVEREPRLYGVPALHEPSERFDGAVGSGAGEEADVAEVDAQDWDAALAGDSRPAEQGPVTAETDENVERLLAVEGVRAVSGDEVRDLRLEHQPRAKLGRFGDQLGEEVDQGPVTPIPDEPDVHDGMEASSAWSARTRAAMPSAVRPTSSSWRARGACS